MNKRRERKVIRKIHTDAEILYREMKRGKAILICTLPRKQPDISQLVPYESIIVLSNWN